MVGYGFEVVCIIKSAKKKKQQNSLLYLKKIMFLH